jgi:Xaa-Pro aminopeptidase
MTLFHHGDFGGEVKMDPSNPANYGIAKRVMTPSFPAISYTQGYDAELAAREIRQAGYRTVGVVGGFMMYHGFASRLGELLAGVRLVDSTEAVDDIKAVKSAEDIKWIRRAAAMQDEIFAKVRAYAQPGLRDYDVMAYSNLVGEVLGGETGYFLGSSSPWDKPALFRMKNQHGRRIAEGDVLVWQAENSGPGGFFVHLCRYIVFGKAPQELVDRFNEMVEAQKFTTSLLVPGALCRDVYSTYNGYMRKRGLAEERRLHCHSQGYENVERPLVRDDERMAISADMNIGIHPVFQNARVAATVCDNFLTKADGSVERLHQTPQSIVEL